MGKYTRGRKYFFGKKNKYRIMKNYFKAKLDTVQKIAWNDQGANFITGNTGTTRNLNDLIQLCPDWGHWRELFHTYKLTGVKVEISPNFPTFGSNYVFQGAACMGLLTTRDISNWNNVSESNFNFLLSPTEIQKKYKSFNGGLSAWHGTDDTADLDGKFCCETDGNPSSGVVTFMVKFTFYITFKNPN